MSQIKSKPRIGYTTQDYSFDALKWLTALCIWLTGGKPIRLHPKKPHFDEGVDGLVIGGGIDLYPALYKHDPKPNYKYDHERDKLEITWLKKAEADNIPVLGICRGAQLINVARGGTLHVDVEKVYENAKYPTNTLARMLFRKDINIECGSLLEKLLKTQRIAVNSMHKQAVDKIGKNLTICAKEDNGVVQAIEDPDRDFFIGVQFHPEALIHQKIFRDMFTTLIEVARKN